MIAQVAITGGNGIVLLTLGDDWRWTSESQPGTADFLNGLHAEHPEEWLGKPPADWAETPVILFNGRIVFLRNEP